MWGTIKVTSCLNSFYIVRLFSNRVDVSSQENMTHFCGGVIEVVTQFKWFTPPMWMASLYVCVRVLERLFISNTFIVLGLYLFKASTLTWICIRNTSWKWEGAFLFNHIRTKSTKWCPSVFPWCVQSGFTLASSWN